MSDKKVHHLTPNSMQITVLPHLDVFGEEDADLVVITEAKNIPNKHVQREAAKELSEQAQELKLDTTPLAAGDWERFAEK